MKKTKYHSEIVADEKRAPEILRILYGEYVDSRKLFRYVNRETHAPQRKYVPADVPLGGFEHRKWLFFAAMTDRREESERVYASHKRLFSRARFLYTDEVMEMPPQRIAEILKSEKIGSPGQSAKYWPRCTETLYGDFFGDPIHLYKEKSIAALLAFKKSRAKEPLPGFGPKILSLLSLFYEELGLMQMPEDAFPVDVHVQRFAISTGIIQGSGKVTNEDVEKVLRPLLCAVVREEGWSALELSHAIWFLGNRLCKGCYQKRAAEFLCPAYGYCGGSISTKPYFRHGVWDFDALRHRKGGDRDFILFENAPLFTVSGG